MNFFISGQLSVISAVARIEMAPARADTPPIMPPGPERSARPAGMRFQPAASRKRCRQTYTKHTSTMEPDGLPDYAEAL